MKGKNMILLSVAVLAVGLFILPQTMAMFIGQHTWYSVKTTDAQYNLCEKCHVNEVYEWKANTGAHAQYSEDLGGGCFCHQINETALGVYGLTETLAPGAYGFNFTNWRWNTSNTTSGKGSGSPEWYNASANGGAGAWEWGWRPGLNQSSGGSPHAAVIIDCVDCHYNEMVQINNPDSAHFAFWNQTKTGSNANTDNNTVCMACHTHTHLNITWERIEGLTIIANHTNASLNGSDAWNLTINTNDEIHRSRALYNGTGNSTYQVLENGIWVTYTWNATSGNWEQPPTYGVTIISTPSSQSTDTASNATYVLEIRNIGTVADSYSLGISNLDGADTAEPDRYVTGSIAAGAHDFVLLYVGDASTGKYNVTVTAVGLATAATGNITTTVT